MKKDKTLHKWEVPHEKHFLLKPEAILLAILVVFVFLFSFSSFDKKLFPTIVTVVSFIAVFFVINYLVRKLYPLKEKYHITSSGITIKSKSGKKETKVNIKFKNIMKFKLDKFFHGGRIETKDKRHSLYFNTKQEIEKLEKIFKKKIKN
ncbi:hypothetical protein ACFL0E_00995 [Nanoarchaeota archaeon]